MLIRVASSTVEPLRKAEIRSDRRLAGKVGMKRCRVLFAVCALALVGCAGHDVYLVGRTSGLTAHNKFRILHPGGDVSFKIGDEVYTGRWVYVRVAVLLA